MVSPEIQPSQQDIYTAQRQRADVDDAFRSILDTLLDEFDDVLTGVDVQRAVIHDRHPAEALPDVSRGADLLVVGSRGHGGSPSCYWSR